MATARSRSEMGSVEPGAAVVVVDAFGNEHDMVALTGVETDGHDFPVVWVRDPQRRESRIPWPVESLRLASTLDA